MGKKKIQKSAKEAKADEDNHSASEHEPEAAQEPEAPKADEPQSAGRKGAGRKKGGKGKEAGNNEQNENKESKEVKEVELFTEEFNQRVDEFKSFYREYLQLRSTSGNVDADEEYRKVSEDVRNKIQQACLRVLKKDTSDAEQWLENQQKAIREQIANVDKAEVDTRKALGAAGTFSAAEIDQQVAGIHKKKATLQQSLSDLQQIKLRAGQIYNNGDNPIDQQ